MDFNSSRFGPVSFDDASVFLFKNGIPGFDELSRWVLLGEEDTPIKWLHSVQDSEIALPVTHPYLFLDSYSPRFSDEDLEPIRCGSDEGLTILVVLSVPDGSPEQATANLKAPLVFNQKTRLGAQLLALNDEYSLRYPIFQSGSSDSLKPPSTEETL